MRTETTHKFEELLNAMPCYVVLLDRSRNVLWSNRLAARDFNGDTAKKCWDLYGFDKSRCGECPAKKAFRDGQMHTKETSAICKAGTRMTLLERSSLASTTDSGKPVVLVASVDVTPLKDLQRQLILLGETVAGMAHSIKNIMMGLEGGIYVVNKGIEAKNQQEVKEGWEMVLLNFEKISRIVKDILYCSKERTPDFQSIEPNNIVREVFELFQENARRYNIELRLDLDERLGEAIIDPHGFHTVVTNLVSNALDACKWDVWKDDHTVEIRSRRGWDDSTIIEVADNGMGIDRELQGHVFEDFFSSKGDKGTGLGLMVTQKIMREHGGAVTFRSRPQQGTTFVANFPPGAMPKKLAN